MTENIIFCTEFTINALFNLTIRCPGITLDFYKESYYLN